MDIWQGNASKPKDLGLYPILPLARYIASGEKKRVGQASSDEDSDLQALIEAHRRVAHSDGLFDRFLECILLAEKLKKRLDELTDRKNRRTLGRGRLRQLASLLPRNCHLRAGCRTAVSLASREPVRAGQTEWQGGMIKGAHVPTLFAVVPRRHQGRRAPCGRQLGRDHGGHLPMR